MRAMRCLANRVRIGLAVLLLAGLGAGCDLSDDDDEFERFEGSWIVSELQTADRSGGSFNSIKARLDSRYASNVVFTFEEINGNPEFDIAGDIRDTEDDLFITGDVSLNSDNTLLLISLEDPSRENEEFFLNGEVFAEYSFIEGDLVMDADDNDAKALLEALTNRDYSNDRRVRVTLRRS